MIDVVQSVDRTLSILELLSNYDEGLGVTEIGVMVNLHKSTVHRLLGTLIYKGFVIQDASTNKYKLSLKLYELGCKRIANVDIFKSSKPYTERLMKTVNEVVHLVIRDENDIVYIDKVEADNTIRMASTIGRRSPLYRTSVGKVILAYLPDKEIESVWENSKIEKMTEYTITDLEVFKRNLKEVKEKGYAVDNEENELGVRCIGAPVFNHKGCIEGAISVSGPTIRVTSDRIDEIANEVKKYAHLISDELGYRGN